MRAIHEIMCFCLNLLQIKPDTNVTRDLLELLVCSFDIGAGIFQSGYHLIRRNHAGVIGYGVNLPETLKTSCYLFDALQPLQG